MGSGKRRITLHPRVKTKSAATQQARLLQDEWDATIGQRPGSPPASAVGWIDFAARVLEERTKAASPGSLRNWIPNLNRFVERFTDYIGDVSLEAVTPAQCRAYLADRRGHRNRQGQKPSPSTLKKERDFLSSIFERARKDRIITENPWWDVKGPAEPPSSATPLSADEFERLVATAPADRAFRYLFLGFTGCRPNEGKRARWRDIDFQSGRIRLPNSEKGRTAGKSKFRNVDLCRRHLNELRRRRGMPGELIFPHHNNWLRDLRLDCRTAEIDVHTIKDFRHSFGTWCAYMDISEIRLRRLMDHSAGTRTTSRYLHLADGAGTVPRGFPEIVTKSSPAAIEWSPEGDQLEAIDI